MSCGVSSARKWQKRLYLARAKEQGNIFHCVIPAREGRGKGVFSADGTSRRAEIAAKFLRSLGNLFSARRSANSPALPLRPPFLPLVSPRDANLRSAASSLTKSRLNLSRTFVETSLLVAAATRASRLTLRRESSLREKEGGGGGIFVRY